MSKEGKGDAAEDAAAGKPAAEKATAEGGRTDARAGQVRVRLPNGEHSWVSAEAFNLISEREFRDSEGLRRLRGQRNLAAAVAGVAALIVAAGAVSLLTREPQAAAGPAAPPAAAVEGAAGSAEPQARAPAPPPSPEVKEIESAVRSWAGAWAARDVEAVLGFYSPAFLVPDDMSRDTWEALQRERVTSPEMLAVTLDQLTVESTGPESAAARCLLIYDTPGYRVWVDKTLELVLEPGGWRIADEVTSMVEVGVGSYETVQP